MAKAIPEGYHSITPYLVVKGAAKALDWYKENLGAEEIFRMDGPNGSIGHAEFRIGNSMLMIADENADWDSFGPEKHGGSPISLMIYCEGVDHVFAKAVKNGGQELKPVQDWLYGDRSGTLKDPFGHVWTISTHMEDVSPEELERRMAQMG